MKIESILHDSGGCLSSKRVSGLALIFMGIVFSIILFIFSLMGEVGDANTATNIINTLLYSGGGLLGIGVFEKLKK